jgi:uncharacterized protein YbjT (DUF2867 family)
MQAQQIHVVGASGRSGAVLCRALMTEGAEVIPVVRSPERWAATGIPIVPRVADLLDQASLDVVLRDAATIVSAAHARFVPALIRAARADARMVLLGSTRKFTRWPDAHGNGVLDGERAFMASGCSGVILHPTMIYGAQGEDNVQRLAALLQRLPIVPLPGGGRALVQPIHQGDVTRSILAALARNWDGPHSLVIAGPAPLPYADFVRAVAQAAGQRSPRIVPLPAAPLIMAAPLSRLIPLFPTIRSAEIRRLLEDKAFDIGPMQAELGVTPAALREGLARTFDPTF